MDLSRVSQGYRDGVQRFLNFAFDNASQDNLILCPCLKCANINWHGREVVHEHLVVFGFLRGYTIWFFHGECLPSRSSSIVPPTSRNNQNHSSGQDDIEGMLRDAFNMHSHGSQTSSPEVLHQMIMQKWEVVIVIKNQMEKQQSFTNCLMK